jgi:YVTN family beta-propeller protein
MAWYGTIRADAVVATVATGNTPVAICIDTVTDRIYVANYMDNSVTVINGTTNATATIGIGAEPLGIAVNPATHIVYAADGSDNAVSVINGTTNAVSSVNIGNQSWAVAVNPVTDKIYVLDNAGIAVINGTTNAVSAVGAAASSVDAGIAPYQIELNPATDMIYAVNSGGSDVTVINGATNAASNVAVVAAPAGVAINPSTGIAYVAGGGDTSLTAIAPTGNTPSNIARQTSILDAYAGSLAVNPVTDMIYAGGLNDIVAINGSTNATSVISTGTMCYVLAVNPLTDMVYGANSDGNCITVMNGATNSFSTLQAGTYPVMMALNTVTGYLYVVNENSNNVTVVACTPPVPLLAAPASGTANQPPQIALSWNSAPWAGSYGIQVSTSIAFNSTVLSQTGMTQTNVTVRGLSNGATCYWRVDAGNAGGTSAWSAIWSFTVAPLPAAPVLASPTSGTVTQLSGLTLDWNSVAAATSYTLQSATSSGFSTTFAGQTGLSGLSMPVGGLVDGETYFWRVYATGPGGSGPWSNAWSFTDQTAPAAPALASPSNGATVRGASLTLSWNTVQCSAYHVQYSISSTFTMVADTILSGATRVTVPLTLATAYYWRVLAINSAGNGPWSSAWSFTVSSVSVLPQESASSPRSLSLSKSGIAYELPAVSSVSIVLYDMQGRQVRQLVNGMQNAGSYRIAFNHARITTGYYIVEFKAGTFVVQKRLALID